MLILFTDSKFSKCDYMEKYVGSNISHLALQSQDWEPPNLMHQFLNPGLPGMTSLNPKHHQANNVEILIACRAQTLLLKH